MTTSTMTGSPLAVVTQEPIVAGALFGPVPIYPGVLDPLVWLAWRCHDSRPQPDQIIKVDPRELSASGASSGGLSWLSHIQPARDSEEQNLEVIVMAGQLFYRAVREINVGEEMMAWFSKDLKEALRLPSVPSTTVEGELRYYCTLCNEVFRFCNPVVAHLMYRCSKRGYPTSANTCKSSQVNETVTPVRESSTPPATKPRVQGFDIASLAESSTQYNSESRVTEEEPKTQKQTPSPGLTNHRVTSDPERSPSFSSSSNKRVSSSEDSPPNHAKKPKVSSASRDRILADTSSMRSYEDPQSRLTTTSTDTSYTGMRSSNSRNGLLSPSEDSVKIESHQDSLSAFKKVDKMSSQPVPVLSQVSAASHSYSIPISTMSPAEMLYRSAMNPLHPFPYPLPSVASSPPGGATLPPSLVSAVPHSLLSSASELSSAFGPAIGYTNGDSMAKLQQEMKLQRPADILDNRNIYSPAHANNPRLSNFAFPYTKSFPTPLDNFASKSVPTSLLSFLPPSLAALTFPTQNWCAKCNATFRMTSDLVYHMRSHHKRDLDPNKKKREEKLRCSICNETFRERHHLTRHMTSHQ